MPSIQHDTFFARIWGTYRRRTRLFVVAVFVLFITTFISLSDYAISTSSFAATDMTVKVPSTVTATVTVTSTYTSPPHVETVTVNEELISQREPVVFSLIMWSRASAMEGALLIKTILLYTTSTTELHIICDQPARDFLETRFSLLTYPARPIKVRFYQPSLQSMKDRVAREGSIQSDHSAGLPGLMKLFIHEILPASVKKAIYIDTDAFFISDPTVLWNVFSQLKPTTAVVMSYHPDQSSPEWNHASRICSCVMLLDLEKLRKLRLMDSSVYREVTDGSYPSALSPPTFRVMYGEPGPDGYNNVKLGDQGYWWAIVDNREDIFEPLSFDFEVTSCLMDTYNVALGEDGISEADELPKQCHVKGTPQEGTLIRPKLLHFNCLHGTEVYMDWEGWLKITESVTQRWGPALSYHHGYKWIWLNLGVKTNSGKSLVDIGADTNIVFADLQLARDHAVVIG